MGATGYIIKGQNGGSSEPQKQVEVTPADGTIDVERVESPDVINFRIKTTYDGYETIDAGSPNYGGYFRAIHIKFNEQNRRYRLVCILNGGSYTPVAKDFAFYYIKFGWKTGGENDDHWYIEEFSRQGNGAYVALEKISKSEYNVLIHTPTGYAYANIGILKEDKEADVTIEHFNPQRTRYTPTGTIITTEIPSWKNGSPAVWSVIPEVQTPVPGQLGHYYNGDRNLYFYDGYNWHNVYALAQGVASLLATADRPATANEGTIYYDTTEQNLKIFYGGEWKNAVSNIIKSNAPEIDYPGTLKFSLNDTIPIISVYTRAASGGRWQIVQTRAYYLTETQSLPTGTQPTTRIVWLNKEREAFYRESTGWVSLNHKIKNGQVVTFSNSLGETIAAEDRTQIIVTASFGSVSILDFTNITKEEGKTIEINILSGSIIRVKDGATEIDLTGCNESVVKAFCLSDVWHYYKTCSITEIV